MMCKLLYFETSPIVQIINLETAVRNDKVMQDFDSEEFAVLGKNWGRAFIEDLLG